MPVDWSKYPDDWEDIAKHVKEQAGWKCEKCDLQCYFPGEKHENTRRTLTVAHINHIEMDCTNENLVALCPKCHLQYDGYRKEMQRLAKKRIKNDKKNQLFN